MSDIVYCPNEAALMEFQDIGARFDIVIERNTLMTLNCANKIIYYLLRHDEISKVDMILRAIIAYELLNFKDFMGICYNLWGTHNEIIKALFTAKYPTKDDVEQYMRKTETVSEFAFKYYEEHF